MNLRNAVAKSLSESDEGLRLLLAPGKFWGLLADHGVESLPEGKVLSFHCDSHLLNPYYEAASVEDSRLYDALSETARRSSLLLHESRAIDARAADAVADGIAAGIADYLGVNWPVGESQFAPIDHDDDSAVPTRQSERRDEVPYRAAPTARRAAVRDEVPYEARVTARRAEGRDETPYDATVPSTSVRRGSSAGTPTTQAQPASRPPRRGLMMFIVALEAVLIVGILAVLQPWQWSGKSSSSANRSQLKGSGSAVSSFIEETDSTHEEVVEPDSYVTGGSEADIDHTSYIDSSSNNTPPRDTDQEQTSKPKTAPNDGEVEPQGSSSETAPPDGGDANKNNGNDASGGDTSAPNKDYTFPTHWEGAYVGSTFGEAGGTVTTPRAVWFDLTESNGTITGTCSVGLDGGEKTYNGSYKVEGEYNHDTGEVTLNATEWINQGDLTGMRNFYGKVGDDMSSMSGTCVGTDSGLQGDFNVTAS